MGRKEKYTELVEPRLKTIKAWKRKGLIDEEICKNLGISPKSFYDYKKKYPQFARVLKTGKSDADAQVENALFRRAIGYEYDEVHESIRTSKDGKSKLTHKRVIRKFIPPDITAMIFYLKNRCSKDWHDRKQHEVGGMDGKPLNNIHLVLPDNGMNHDSRINKEED